MAGNSSVAEEGGRRRRPARRTRTKKNAAKSNFATRRAVDTGVALFESALAQARTANVPVNVTISPDGSAEIVPAKQAGRSSAHSAAPFNRSDPLDEARSRGKILAARILERDDMLSAEALAQRLGITRMTVNSRRHRGELLGLDGAKRGFRFPAWQVDEEGNTLVLLPQLFKLLGPNPWTVYRFLTDEHNALDGMTAITALEKLGEEAVLDAAESLARGEPA